MQASVLLSSASLLIVAAVLVFAIILLNKRKNISDRTDLNKPHPDFSKNGMHSFASKEEISHGQAIQNHWNPDLESVIRGISTPLNTMIGNMELLEHLQLSEEQQKRWKAVRVASDEIFKKISDTLDYCNLENGRITVERMDFDVCEMVAKSISPFIKKAKSKNIKIHMRSAHFPIFINNDQIRISQILGHLLDNSIQFTNDGYIIVSLEKYTQDSDSHILRIVVEDSGIGIPSELHEAIFQPFMSSTKREGLGLAICKSLCNKLNARISVSSTPGSGSRFTMELSCDPSSEVNLRNAAYRDALRGQSIIFICAFKEWQDSIIPHLEYWGLTVEAYDDPGRVDQSHVTAASCVVFFGTTGQWSAQAENEIIAEAAYIIECNESNSLELKKSGRTILLSCYSLNSLFKAFEHVASPFQSGAISPHLLSPHVPAMPPAHVVEAFKKSLRNSLRNIRASITSGNGSMVVQELHNLSGSFAVLNDKEFSRKCIHLENSIKMEGLSPSTPALEVFISLLTNRLEHTM